MSAFTSQERRAAVTLSFVYITRMMGLFLLLPVLSILAQDLSGATPLLIGLAVGVYALFQALLQIPFGLLSDRFGRKPVILSGLAIFIAGSIVAAWSDSIWGIIAGRALQGVGAISSVVMALAADLTRDSQRTKIMAIIGASIGLSFIASIIIGPVLMGRFDLSGIFYFIAASAAIAALLVVFVVPDPDQKRKDRNVSVETTDLLPLLKNRELLKIDFGIFLLHLLITASFVCVPLKLIELGVAANLHWKLYLAGAAGSLLIVLPMIGIAEKKLSVKLTMMISIVGLAVAEMLLGIAGSSFWFIVAAMVVFFGFLSVLESMLPSLVSRTAPASLRGTAMGVYSSSQFLGAFLGGVTGGWLVGNVGTSRALFVLGGLCLMWLLVARWMKNPPKLKNYRLALNTASLSLLESGQNLEPDQGPESNQGLEYGLHARLMSVPGVAEVSIISAEGAAYLKVDRHELDETLLLSYSKEGE